MFPISGKHENAQRPSALLADFAGVRLIIDTDPGVDDAVALLYLAAMPQADIVAVGSVQGNVPASTAAANAARILQAGGAGDVPVAVGARQPLAQCLHTAELVHGEDGLGGQTSSLPQPRPPVRESAAEQLVTLARAHPGELVLLAIGPATNLALALLLEPDLPRLLRRIVVMGGALEVPGNITPSAEANTWHDPEAADLLYQSGADITVVSLDSTNRAVVDADWIAQLSNLPGPRARLASALLGHYSRIYTEFAVSGIPLHDPLAAAIAVDPDLATYRALPIDVELRGSHTRGRTVIDQRGFRLPGEPDPRQPVQVVDQVDHDRFRSRLLDAFAPSRDTTSAPGRPYA